MSSRVCNGSGQYFVCKIFISESLRLQQPTSSKYICRFLLPLLYGTKICNKNTLIVSQCRMDSNPRAPILEDWSLSHLIQIIINNNVKPVPV